MAEIPNDDAPAPAGGGAEGRVVRACRVSRRPPLPPPAHDGVLPKGDRNENPPGIGLFALIAEDFRTHDRMMLEPGFIAIAVHRFGNARMGIRFAPLRAPLTLLYRIMFALVDRCLGIDLPYTARLGRRVRIWHHGGMVLGARAIGDDVHIRHNTTFGVLNRRELTGKPIIGNRVDIGVGACIMGAVTIGDDCVIGPNSVVLRDVPTGSVVMGIPARQVNMRAGTEGQS
jgi:serine O-acetyltransferase